MVVDRHANPEIRVGLAAEHAERQTLEREIRVRAIGGFDKAASSWIVGLVESEDSIMVCPIA